MTLPSIASVASASVIPISGRYSRNNLSASSLFSFVDVSCFFKKLTALACAASFLVPFLNKEIVQNSLSKSSKYLSITAKYLSFNLEWNFSSNSALFDFSFFFGCSYILHQECIGFLLFLTVDITTEIFRQFTDIIYIIHKVIKHGSVQLV